VGSNAPESALFSPPPCSDTLECYDDGAIEEEELAAFGLVLELFNHAIDERRVALQAGTLEPRVAAIGSSPTSRR